MTGEKECGRWRRRRSPRRAGCGKAVRPPPGCKCIPAAGPPSRCRLGRGGCPNPLAPRSPAAQTPRSPGRRGRARRPPRAVVVPPSLLCLPRELLLLLPPPGQPGRGRGPPPAAGPPLPRSSSVSQEPFAIILADPGGRCFLSPPGLVWFFVGGLFVVILTFIVIISRCDCMKQF